MTRHGEPEGLDKTSPVSSGRGSVDGETAESALDGSDLRSQANQAHVYHCDLCGHAMLDLHCKLICKRCGYKRDCSDP